MLRQVEAITVNLPHPGEMPGSMITLHALGAFTSSKSLTVVQPVDGGSDVSTVTVNSAVTAFKCYFSDGSRWFVLA